MRYAVLYYIASTLVYFWFGTGSAYWATFNMISLLAYILAVNSFYVRKRPIDKETREWMEFANIITIVRTMYTVACMFEPPVEWIYFCNRIFVIIFALWMLIKFVRTIRIAQMG